MGYRSCICVGTAAPTKRGTAATSRSYGYAYTALLRSAAFTLPLSCGAQHLRYRSPAKRGTAALLRSAAPPLPRGATATPIPLSCGALRAATPSDSGERRRYRSPAELRLRLYRFSCGALRAATPSDSGERRRYRSPAELRLRRYRFSCEALRAATPSDSGERRRCRGPPARHDDVLPQLP
ncbi:hypothetical protein [Paenibacillus herberti]|uniref:hypothetical protein n=1 Tax=Paenibacillus herberti TaxID=1619309 RepID=UPI0011325110|nr:hypothetical protein [Paenibacillus herberti]